MESSVNRVIQQFGLDPAAITEQIQSGKVSVQDAAFKAIENYYYITGGQLPTKEEVAKLVSAVNKVYQDRGFLQKLSENVDPTTAVGVAAAVLLTTLGVKGLQKKFLKRSAQKVIKGEAKAATKEVETAVRKTRFQEQTKPRVQELETRQKLETPALTGKGIQEGKAGGYGKELGLTSDTIAQEGGTELKALPEYRPQAQPPATPTRPQVPPEVQTAVQKMLAETSKGVSGDAANALAKILDVEKQMAADSLAKKILRLAKASPMGLDGVRETVDRLLLDTKPKGLPMTEWQELVWRTVINYVKKPK
jgi:multidrug efflux pump subunit AcrB